MSTETKTIGQQAAEKITRELIFTEHEMAEIIDSLLRSDAAGRKEWKYIPIPATTSEIGGTGRIVDKNGKEVTCWVTRKQGDEIIAAHNSALATRQPREHGKTSPSAETPTTREQAREETANVYVRVIGLLRDTKAQIGNTAWPSLASRLEKMANELASRRATLISSENSQPQAARENKNCSVPPVPEERKKGSESMSSNDETPNPQSGVASEETGGV